MQYKNFILSLTSSQIFNLSNYYLLCKYHFPEVSFDTFTQDLTKAQNSLYSFSHKNHDIIFNNFKSHLSNLNLNGFILNTTDEYLNEYPPISTWYINYLTGFSGSLALVIILKDTAAIFVDGRYTLQAQTEVNPKLFQILPLTQHSIKNFLLKNSHKDEIVGISSTTFTENEFLFYQEVLHKNHTNIKPFTKNPLDTIWKNKPLNPISPLLIQPQDYQGDSHNNKLNTVFNLLKSHHIQNYLITSCSNISWLLNLKSQDIPNNPTPLCYGLIQNNQSFTLYINSYCTTNVIKSYYKDINIKDLTSLESDLSSLPKSTPLYFSLNTPFNFKNICHTNNISTKYDTINLISSLKTVKNQKELSNIKNCHLQDSISLLNLFYFIFKNPLSTHTELSISDCLDNLKSQDPLYFSNSFTSIIGIDENSAIVHYRPQQSTNKKLTSTSCILIDCGSHYLNGTTDITRSICLDNTNQMYKKYYTLVLKGHISLASSYIPLGYTFGNIDILARQFLHQNSLDYAHGTGHGVGYFNNVHEEPISLNSQNTTEIKEGMIFSIEPGYYETNNFGIRLENLYEVTLSTKNSKFLQFNPLSYFPFNLSNIDKSLLSTQEIDWLNNYHNLTQKKLLPLIKNSDLKDLLLELTQSL